MKHFYKFNRGMFFDAKTPEPNYNNDVFLVTVEYGRPYTKEEMLKHYKKYDKNLLNIPVTTAAIEMVAETLCYEAKGWPILDRKPHYDELENAYFAEYSWNGHRPFSEQNEEYLAKTDNDKYGFKQPAWLCNLFYRLRNDLKEYYNTNNIQMPKTLTWDEIYYSLWNLAILTISENEWKRISAKRVPLGSCIYCGETIWSSNIGFLDWAGDIGMGFGYGSLRDTTYVKAFIHDHCSLKWQKSWKGVYPCNEEYYLYNNATEYKKNLKRLESHYKKYEKDNLK